MSMLSPQDIREFRRFRAFELTKQGWQQAEIAEALGVTQGAVSQWLSRARNEGEEGLRNHKASGRPPKLTTEMWSWVLKFMELGPEAFGFEGEIWTAGRVAQLIEREFGICYHPDHVGRQLRRLGMTPQKPCRKARQRDEAAIKQWLQSEWPRIKKTLKSNSEG